MTTVETLRSEYVTARRDVARSEKDLSQATTLLSELRNQHTLARRGKTPAGLAETLAALDAELAGWAYDTDAVPAPDETGPTLASFDIETTADLHDQLRRAYADAERDRFEQIVSVSRQAVDAADESETATLSTAFEALTDAFESGEETYEMTLESTLETLDRSALDVAALDRLARDARGETSRDALSRLQTDAGRAALLDAIETAISDADPRESDSATEAPDSGSAETDSRAFSLASAPLVGALRGIEAFADARRDRLGEILDRLTDEYPVDPADALPGMDGGTPTLLTPTRLETRFVETPSAQDDYELKVRIYPDDVHVDTHERELTDEEITWGLRFWQQVWWASHEGSAQTLRSTIPDEILGDVDLDSFPDDAERRHAAVLERAWNQLEDRFGPERAAWVKRELAPRDGEALLDWSPDDPPVPDVDFEALRAGADRRPDAWTRPPRARALPDQWIAFAEVDGATETARSKPVRTPLAVGPDPDQLGAATGQPSSESLRDGEMDWVFDFDAAMGAGMALTMPLSESQVSAGVDRLVVVGVSTALDRTDGGHAVADLLDAHQYTDGLSFVERGTPTNDTREAAAGTAPGDAPTPFELACGAAGDVSDDSDAARAATLLGLDPATLGTRDRPVFDGVAGAGGAQADAERAMNAALWDATWGYYLPHMLAPEHWTDAVQPRPEFLRWLESYRRHFVEYVRAGGPVPTLRVGDQPYGVLPTTVLDDWSPVDGYEVTIDDGRPDAAGSFTYDRLARRDAEADLVDRLRSVRAAWADATADVPSIDSPDNPEAVVADILSMAGTSYGYRLRELLGEDLIAEVLGDQATAARHVDSGRQRVTSAVEQYFPNADAPRVGGLLAATQAPPVREALVADDLGDYLRALRTMPHGALREGPPGVGLALEDAPNIIVWLLTVLFDLDDASLSEVLFYHGLAESYRLARVRLGMHYEQFGDIPDTEKPWAQTPWALFPEPERYDDGDLTLWAALDQPISDALANHPRLSAGTTYGEALQRVPDLDRGFAAMVDALETLESLDDGQIERLVAETLDLASHRFDAWATSVATRRLDGMRTATGGGLYVGAYGYVEDLQHEPDDRSDGYIQAPSVGQATTAAVLRSGHEAGRGGDALAVDLSADRVRDATRLVDAVRSGVTLGEALGYRFERALHEDYPAVELDAYVPAFRALAPLADGNLDRAESLDSAQAAERTVLDGVRLVELWRADDIDWGQPVGSHDTTLPSPTTDTAAYDAITAEIDSLDATLDAVSDVLTADGVHQLVSGNPERAGSSLDALSRGEAPPDLPVTETPRTGVACTHRLFVFPDPEATTWGDETAPRALAEPALNNWVGSLLGDPGRAVCRVAFTPRPTTVGSGDDETVTTPDWRVTAVRLSDLDRCPLDFVSLVAGDGEAWQSELEERIGYHVRRSRDDIDPVGEIRISFEPPAEWPDPAALGVDPDADLGVGPFLEAVRGVREVVTSARPADGRDVTLPGEDGDPGLRRGPLEDRADAVQPMLADAVATMDDLTAVFDRPTDDAGTALPSVLDALAELVDALVSVGEGPVRAVERELADLDPDAVGAELAALVAVARGDAVALALGPTGEPTVDAREAVLRGLTVARPRSEVDLTASFGGETHDFETTVGRGGVFEVELPDDLRADLRPGSSFDLRLDVDGVTMRATVAYERGRGRPGTPSFAGPALREAAEVADAFGRLSRSTEAVATARDDLDGATVRAAADRITVEQWPDPGDRASLDAVLAVASISLPGFAGSDGWAELGGVLEAVADDRLTGRMLRREVQSLPPDADELADRTTEFREETADGIDALEDAFDAAETDPATALAVGGMEALRAALLVASDVGIHGSVPVEATGATTAVVAALTEQAVSVSEEATERLDAAAATGDDAAGQRDRIEALFDDAFEVLPPFEAPNDGELTAALQSSHDATLLGDDSLAAETWFQRVARVRDVPRALGSALTYGESLGDLSPADGSRFRVAQLPYEDPDTWVGRPEAWDGEPPTGTLSLVAHAQWTEPRTELVGLFVDEFVETVPSDTETTGLSFHYDKPGNRAPQAMLLAVPPTDEDWSLRTLADIVTESVDLAKLRTVDRTALSDAGHLVPAMTVATNESDSGPDTASVDADALGPEWWYLDEQGGEN